MVQRQRTYTGPPDFQRFNDATTPSAPDDRASLAVRGRRAPDAQRACRSAGHEAADAAGDQRHATSRSSTPATCGSPTCDGAQRPAADDRRRASSRIRCSRPTARRSRSARSTTATSTSTPSRSTGGAPTRLTWHPGADIVQGFTPDGKAVLFTSQRAVFTDRYTQLFTVPGRAAASRRRCRSRTRRAPPTRRTASASPTTRSAARVPAVEAVPRRHARRASGSTTRKDHAVEKIPQPAARAQRHRPDVDRRHGLLPLRPQRRVQPVRLRHEDASRSGS